MVDLNFTPYIRSYQQRKSNTNCQAKQVYKRKKYVFVKAAPGGFDIVSDHNIAFKLNPKFSNVPYCYYLTYSERKLCTGFAIAALIACELTVSNANTIAVKPATKYTHRCTSIL